MLNETQWISSQQPATYDFLRPNGFKFIIDGLPNVNYTCQGISLPGINLGTAIRETPFVAIPLPGDKIVFNELSINYIVSKEMENYLELFKWVQALGFPESYAQYRNLMNIDKNKRAVAKSSLETSDATLVIFSAENNPIFSIKFFDIYPTTISNIDFDLRTTTVDYLTSTVSFRYRSFDFNI